MSDAGACRPLMVYAKKFLRTGKRTGNLLIFPPLQDSAALFLYVISRCYSKFLLAETGNIRYGTGSWISGAWELPSTLIRPRQSDSVQGKTAQQRPDFIVKYINIQARLFDGKRQNLPYKVWDTPARRFAAS
jgi:hypothetical protein